jgi:hypothetical protein
LFCASVFIAREGAFGQISACWGTFARVRSLGRSQFPAHSPAEGASTDGVQQTVKEKAMRMVTERGMAPTTAARELDMPRRSRGRAEALGVAIARRTPSADGTLLHHSDRGVQ